MVPDTDRLSVKAPAKVNICLKIVGRRPDGYHDILSLMHKMQLEDSLHLHLRREPGIQLTCPAAELPVDEGNMAFRAAMIFLRHIDAANGLEIVLEKRIPIAAGLGGGSSDAAAVLLGLNRLYRADLNLETLSNLARPLGADVPFFVSPYQAAWATSIGDRLTEAQNLKDGWFVLANPGFPVSTRWAYENFALTSDSNPYMLARGRERADNPDNGNIFGHDAWQIKDVSALGNDLESVTIARFPEIGVIKETMMEAGAECALMSGSGPTVFGFFTERSIAAQCAEALSRNYGPNVFLTRPG